MDLNQYAQLGGTVVTVIAFIYYMTKKDTEFNKIITNHLEHSNKVIHDNSQALLDVSVSLKELCLTVKKNRRDVKK